jgi:5-enolpyruvylshikimate-3-phosphate synthase
MFGTYAKKKNEIDVIEISSDDEPQPTQDIAKQPLEPCKMEVTNVVLQISHVEENQKVVEAVSIDYANDISDKFWIK